MRAFKIALVAAALAAAAFISGSASAMPVSGLTAASNELAGDVQNVRWCGRYRCRYAAPVYVYPPAYYSPYYTYYGWPYYRPYWGLGWGWGWGPRWWW